MKLFNKAKDEKGSVLIWVMVALLVIALLATLVLTISSRFFSSTVERALDSQAYHSAYSMTRSISNWIVSYDPELAKKIPVTEEVKAEIEKKDFIEALQNGPLTIDASQAGGAPEEITKYMGDCTATVTYSTDPKLPDVATIEVLSTAKFEDREFSIKAILESSFTRSNVSKNVKFNSTFTPSDFGLTVNVVSEINGVVSDDIQKSWPELAKNPAFVGRNSGTWRYYTVTVDTYDMNNPSKPAYLSINPKVAGGNSGNATNNRINNLLYYSNPTAGDRNTKTEAGIDFNRTDMKNGAVVNIERLQSATNPATGKPYIDSLDMRVLLDPSKSMLDQTLIDDGVFALKNTTPLGNTGFYAGQKQLLRWPNQDKKATCLLVTGVANNEKIPGTRFTYFTDPRFTDKTKDTNYIIPRYMNGGNSFESNSAVPGPWTAYKSLYLYMLNESDKYFQITGAVSSEGGAIYTKRRFLIGGSYDEWLDNNATTEATKFTHLGNFPTMLKDMQIYYASPASGNLESIIQATPGSRGKNDGSGESAVSTIKPKFKTRINGGWLVIQKNHKLTITDALINTQKIGNSATVNLSDAGLNGTSSEEVSKKSYNDSSMFRSELYIANGHNTIGGLPSGNDIYIAPDGTLEIGKGALILSDIYIDENATLIFPDDSNAVIYGNIYNKGTVDIRSSNIKIYGRPEVPISYGPQIGDLAGGLFNYDEGWVTMSAKPSAVNNLFPNNVDGRFGLHSYVELDENLRAFAEIHDQTNDDRGICSHFDNIAVGKSWHVIEFDDY